MEKHLDRIYSITYPNGKEVPVTEEEYEEIMRGDGTLKREHIRQHDPDTFDKTLNEEQQGQKNYV